MPAPDYGRSLKTGLGLNLLVLDVARAVAFQTEVLGANVTYEDEDFAVLTFAETEWMVHADHTYLDHEMAGLIVDVDARGAGAELRLYGCDPDTAETAARLRGDSVLSGAVDKPHGLREAHIIDPDGYVWVPSRALEPVNLNSP